MRFILEPFALNLASATESKIQAFSRLKDGWSYSEGISFNDTVILQALALLRECSDLGFFKTNAFPGLNGEILLVVYRKNDSLEFTVEPDGTFTFCRDVAGSGEPILGLSFEDAIERIVEARQEEECDLLDFSVPNTMMWMKSDLEVWPLRGKESPYFSVNAPLRRAKVSVPTSTSFIKIKQEPLQFFGNSKTIYFQPEPA
jgi:hypothetical protein